jgi:DNA-binding NtrC family response regulator
MPAHTRVLLVDADGPGASALLELLAPAGYKPAHVGCLAQAVEHLARTAEVADVVLLAFDVAGLAGVTALAGAAPDAELVLLAAPGDETVAREGLRLGASDMVERQRGAEAVLFAVERAARDASRRRELAILRARASEHAQEALMGRSPAMLQVRELVGRAAASRGTVLVTGEAGTGKDVVARLVHDLSDRAGRPFVIVRCERTDGPALEAELFGTVHGGVLEAARGGTLVLDEIGAIPRGLAVRLSRVLAERAVARAEAGELVPVDVRVVLTARVSHDGDVQAARELLGAGNVLRIPLPPLRERRSDIPLLIKHFRTRLSHEAGMEPAALSGDAMTSLLAHQWPGNVRELEHWVERMAFAAPSAGENGTGTVRGPGSDFARLDAANLTLEALERKYILHVLEQEHGHQSRTAERLGIDRRTLYRKLKEYRADGVRGAHIPS